MIYRARSVMEGAGVRLNRVFGSEEAPALDPFLLLDHFESASPRDYLRGFPWHPHRGIETVTYVLEGEIEHGDSLDNSGTIRAGDVQWMTAGSGIIHQEMPRGGPDNRLHGFQLWVNLPASHKMMRPRYREITSNQIPAVAAAEGVTVRVISGEAFGAAGPVRDIVTAPVFLDVDMAGGSRFEFAVPENRIAVAYVFRGRPLVGGADGPLEQGEALLVKNRGSLAVSSGEGQARFLLLSGTPIGEPIAWYGPIVMNTEAELNKAFEEFYNGTFIKQ